MSNETKTDEVIEELQRRIVEGTYKTGQRLPGVRELAEELHVSSPTIRTALNRLQAGNVVDIVPKSGVYVRSRAQRAQIGPFVPPHLKHKSGANLLNVLQAAQAEITVRYLLEDLSVVRPKPEVAQKKNLDEKTDYMRLSRLCLIRGVPYRIIDSYISLGLDDLAKSLDPSNFAAGLEKLLSMASPDALERVQCRMPQEQEAEILQMSRNQPVFDIERWMFAREGLLVEYSQIIANAALHELTYTYSSQAPNWDDYMLKKRLNA